MIDPTHTTANSSMETTRWLWLVWQKFTLPIYVLSVTRDSTRLRPRDILRLARMELHPRTVAEDAYLLPWHQHWRIMKLCRQ